MAERRQHLRQWVLVRMLSTRSRGLTLKEMASETGMGERTIRRDLIDLQSVGFPLVETISDHGRKHWRMADGGQAPELRFTWAEAVAVYLGRRFLEPLAGTVWWVEAQSAFRKLKASLSEPALKHLERMAATFHQTTHGWADYESKAELIDHLSMAIEDRKLTVLTYQSLRSTEPVTYYDVHPYAIVYHKQSLYLIARSLDHEEIRTFKVDRISAVEVQGLQFTPPADFHVQTWLSGAFGIYRTNGRPRRVRLRLRPPASRYLEEKRFHATQTLHPQPDGATIAEFELTALEEIQSFVLSFGPLAEVLEPEELRERVRESLRETLDIYEGTGVVSPRRVIGRQKRKSP